MPGFDRTGPMSEGPMTGGGRGRCNSMGFSGSPGGRGMGRGFRRGNRQGLEFNRGPGRGFGRRGYYPEGERWYGPAYDRPYAMSNKDEVNMLRDEADALNSELDAIKRRIQELEDKSPEQA